MDLTRTKQTEGLRFYMYISAPFARTLVAPCVWCGKDAGKVNLLNIEECQLWIKEGMLCPPCYDRQQEACDEW